MNRRTATRGALVLAAIVGLLSPAGSAFAELPPLTSDLFTPSAEVSASTMQAGAHPDLTLRMTKTPNHCPANVSASDGSCGFWKAVPTGNWWMPYRFRWERVPLYIEQDLRKWIIRFPEGLMADPQATPKCDDPRKAPEANFQYQCPGASQIGTLTGKTRGCTPTSCTNRDDQPIGGKIYNGTPGPGEQGHLYTLLGTFQEDGTATQWVRVDTTIRVDPKTFRIEATTDDIPDFVDLSGQGSIYTLQPYDLTMKLWGKTGAGTGHPLLSNATFCEPRSFDSVFQGYADFSYNDDEGQVHTGTGEGKAVADSTAYPVEGCDALPYEPKLSMALSDTAPESAPAIDTSISQADGEQTTKRAVLRIPGAFKVNTATTVVPCKVEELAADSCSDSARVGGAEAHSRLLPTGPLAGNVTMGAPDGGAFPLRASLKGFVDVAIQGSVGIDQAGGIVATFDDLPPVPISAFAMRLDGGKERAMLINPARCGKTNAVEATFTSHAGRDVARRVPLEVTCGQVDFRVSLGKLRKGELPRLTLATRATGLDRLTHRLPAALASLAEHARKGKALGDLFLRLSRGAKQARLVLASKRGRRLELSARSGGGEIAKLALTKPRSIAANKGRGRGRHSRKRVRRYRGALELGFDRLPHDTVSLVLELGGGKAKQSRIPIRCNKTLVFSMQATDPDGASHAATRTTKARCAKRRPKRRGSREGGR